MNDTKITNEKLVCELRDISDAILQRNKDMRFPSLYPSWTAEGAGPEFFEDAMPLIDDALDTIRRGGRLDATRTAALVHYIADMMEE